MIISLAPLQILILVGIAIAMIIPHFYLWQRTGHSGWWGLLIIVPVLNIISLWVLATKAWPIEETTDAAR